MSEKQITEDQIEEHRKMVTLSGNLSDFQLTNLKTWPFIVFGEDLDKVEINYNFKSDSDQKDTDSGYNVDSLCAGKVSYNFYFNNEPSLSKEELQGRFDHLTLWTKFLFWKDTEVQFQKEGEEWKI